MSNNSIQLIGSGHLRFSHFLRTFEPIVKREIGKATKKNLLLLQRDVRNEIAKGSFQRNSMITQILKGFDQPLVERKEMVNAIEIEQKNEFSGRIGFLKDKKTSHSGDMITVAGILHDGSIASGVKIRITTAMRKYIFGSIRKKNPKMLKKLKPQRSTGFIKIKGRPFMDNVFEDKNKIKMVYLNWENAVSNGIRKSSK